MSPPATDVVVVGVGGVGSAALYHLASRGLSVVGLERFRVPHDWGSSHGESRIFRLAYFEDARYVPLARRALDLWHDLEKVSGERLYFRTGSLDGGPEEGPLFSGSLASCQTHELAHQVMDGPTLSRRFPVFRFPAAHRFVLQPDGGILRPERCTGAYSRMAEALGAELRTGVQVVGWETEGDGVRVFLDDDEGGELRASALVLAPGPWAGTLVPELDSVLEVERQVVGWTRPLDDAPFAAERCPVYNVEVETGHHYGIPSFGTRGPKVGRFGHRGQVVDPEGVDRTPDDEDRALLQDFTDRHLVDAGRIDAMAACLFTSTPDHHFVVDLLDRAPRVALACGFSGHGFKFASAIGEAVAGLVTDDDGGELIGHLSLARPGLSNPAGGR